jgi:holliday junction DNA helicase RuvA
LFHYINGVYTGSGEDFVVVESGGLGFKIHVSSLTEGKMPLPKGSVKLYLHMVMREDHMSLYGFLTEAELAFFKSLISVSGIGPRVGLSLLGSLTLPELHNVITRQDTAALTRIKGVGKKSAQRIILELKEKLPPAETGGEVGLSPLYEAREALLSLGYTTEEASQALAEAARGGSTGRDELIKGSLKYLAERS